MLAAGKASQRALAENAKDLQTITSPLSDHEPAVRQRPDRVLRRPVRPQRLPTAALGDRRIENQLRAIGDPAGVQVEFTGEAENAPPTQGMSDLIGLLAAFVILLILFRALVPTAIPLLFAIVAVLGAFLILFLAARLTHFNTVTEILVPMIGLGVGIDYTLFIVTRFRQFLHDGLTPQEAAAAAGGDRRARGDLRRRDGGDLDHRARADRARLHHEARDRQRPRRADRGAARELAPPRGARSARARRSTAAGSACGRSTSRREGQQRTPVAAWGRFVVTEREGRAARRDRRPAGARLTRCSCARLGLADAGTAPKDQTTRKAYDLLTKGFGPGFTEPIPIVVDLQSRPRGRDQDRDGVEAGAGDQVRRRADLQREDRGQGVGRDHQHATAGTHRRTRRPTTSSRCSGTR